MKEYDSLIDRSILDTILSDGQDDTGDDEVVDVAETANDGVKEQEPDPFEKGDYDFEDFNDPEIMEWMALQEEGTSQKKHVQIEYEEENEDGAFTEIR